MAKPLYMLAGFCLGRIVYTDEPWSSVAIFVVGAVILLAIEIYRE